MSWNQYVLASLVGGIAFSVALSQTPGTQPMDALTSPAQRKPCMFANRNAEEERMESAELVSEDTAQAHAVLYPDSQNTERRPGRRKHSERLTSLKE
jgi:hypothetical protein